MYTVLEYFTDLQDNNYAYKAGDVYPHEGYTPTNDRIKELSGKSNLRKHPIIKKVEIEETIETENATEVEEKPKKRGRKKAED